MAAVSRGVALLIFVVLAVLVFFLAYKSNRTFWASLVLALVIASFVTMLFYPIYTDPALIAIGSITSIIVTLFALFKAYGDMRPPLEKGSKFY